MTKELTMTEIEWLVSIVNYSHSTNYRKFSSALYAVVVRFLAGVQIARSIRSYIRLRSFQPFLAIVPS